jgi:hypothetical protein
MADKPTTVNLNLSGSAMADLRDYCRRTSRTQRDVLSRILTWFVQQRPPIQRVVMGDTEDMAREHAQALRNIADVVERGGAVNVKIEERPNNSRRAAASGSGAR